MITLYLNNHDTASGPVKGFHCTLVSLFVCCTDLFSIFLYDILISNSSTLNIIEGAMLYLLVKMDFVRSYK